jgi:hypothetical protein
MGDAVAFITMAVFAFTNGYTASREFSVIFFIDPNFNPTADAVHSVSFSAPSHTTCTLNSPQKQ